MCDGSMLRFLIWIKLIVQDVRWVLDSIEARSAGDIASKHCAGASPGISTPGSIYKPNSMVN